MSNVATKKVFIQVESEAEQHEHLKQQRKSFKVLQGAATDKENLVGRTTVDKLMLLKSATETGLGAADFIKRKKIETRAIGIQTEQSENKTQDSSSNITVDDLTSDAAPSSHYWERLAERRRVALEDTLKENKGLHDRIEGLEQELNSSKQLLEETKNLVEVLTEMLAEKEQNDVAEEENVSDDADDKALSEITTTDESSADGEVQK